MRSLLTDRLLMAQGAIALLQKNVDEALTLAKKYDKVRINTSDQEQESLDLYETYALQERSLANEI